MSKVNLVKELEDKREGSMKTVDHEIQEVKLLMADSAAAERRALQIAGLDHQVKIAEQKRGVEVERAKFEEEYKGKSFNSKEIQAIAMKYDLRFLQARRFNGTLDGQVAVKLAAFCEAHKNEMGDHSDDFYILAPAKAFHLEERERRPPRPVDPVLFYKVNREDQYIMIHKWGEDFTTRRKFLGYFFKNFGNMFTTMFAGWFLTLSMLAGLMLSSYMGSVGQVFAIGAVLSVISVLFTVFSLAIMFGEWEGWHKRRTSAVWDQPTKRRY